MEVNKLHAPTTLAPGGDFSTYSIGGWVGPRAGRTFGVDKNLLPLPGFEPRYVQPVA